jgi:tetratricopeptide (TPR) repeat protein
VWRVLAQVGRVYCYTVRPVDGVARLGAVREAAGSDAASPGRAALIATLAWLFLASGRFAESVAMAERGATMARALGDERLLADVTARRGVALGSLGKGDQAIAAAEEACALAERLGEQEVLSRASNNCGRLYERTGQFDRARQSYERALAAAERLGTPPALEASYATLGDILFLRGEWGAARARFEQAFAIFRDVGWQIPSLTELLGLARLHLASGEPAEAHRYLEIIASGPGVAQIGWIRLEAAMLLAEWDLVRGDARSARERLAPVLEQYERQGLDLLELHPLVAWAQAELGELAEAAAYAERAVASARQDPEPPALVNALRVQALVLGAQGRRAEAEAALEEGLELARRMPYPYAEARLLYELGLLHGASGAQEQARTALDAALVIFRRLGARPYLERVEDALARRP